MNDLTDFVEKYLALGMAIIPIRQSTKIPLVKWKSFMEEAPSEVQVYKWFKKFPAANIAALMGRVSGNILSIDVDFRNGGENSMKNLELPETFTSRTGGGGYHFLYRSHFTYQKKIGIFPGIDLIAEGGYCVMPPSLHNSGNRYEIHKDLPIRPAPEWITKFLLSKPEHEDSPSIHAPLIPVGHRHESIKRSIMGYAIECFYLTQLWKRSFALVIKCCEPSNKDPFTIGELFDLCLWAWNKAHPYDKFYPVKAWKLLDGSARRRPDIYFAPAHTPLHTFLPNIPKKKQPNNTTTQLPNTPTSQTVSDTDTYIASIPGGNSVWKKS
ncbi:MAG: bifunctional DNA primase/polymerase [Elusimicrobia bacterium]|nr:bifunctional DNA primase/polymerase [Elusimicrobiota bacterium]